MCRACVARSLGPSCSPRRLADQGLEIEIARLEVRGVGVRQVGGQHAGTALAHQQGLFVHA
jgi:hypothetical protein